MLKAQFIDMVKQPYKVEFAQIAELERIVNEYPFFESAHLLYAKGLHRYNALNYSRQLRKTAIVANSRTVLYELLHPKEAPLQALITEIQEPIVETITLPEKKAEPLPENKAEEIVPVNTNPVTITNNDIKIVYINTVPKSTEIPQETIAEKAQQETSSMLPETVNKNSEKETPPAENKEEIEIIQAIENETQTTVSNFNEEELNRSIGDEIGRSVIQSYVETELIKTPELQKEEAEKPLSFNDWLNRVKTEAGTISRQEPEKTEKPVQIEEKRPKTEKKPTNLEQNKNIIDRIIEADPGRIKLGSGKFFTPATDAKQSLLENEHLVTETLAKIYALQGNISKAIRAYEILSLKFPQKSVYFASLIEKLKK